MSGAAGDTLAGALPVDRSRCRAGTLPPPCGPRSAHQAAAVRLLQVTAHCAGVSARERLAWRWSLRCPVPSCSPVSQVAPLVLASSLLPYWRDATAAREATFLPVAVDMYLKLRQLFVGGETSAMVSPASRSRELQEQASTPPSWRAPARGRWDRLQAPSDPQPRPSSLGKRCGAGNKCSRLSAAVDTSVSKEELLRRGGGKGRLAPGANCGHGRTAQSPSPASPFPWHPRAGLNTCFLTAAGRAWRLGPRAEHRPSGQAAADRGRPWPLLRAPAVLTAPGTVHQPSSLVNRLLKPKVELVLHWEVDYKPPSSL